MGLQREVTEFIRACQLHDDGEALLTIEDVEAAWQRPSFVVERDVRAIRDGDALVGFGWLPHAGFAEVHVAPAHRGRGIGTALLRWTWEAARARGDARVGQSIEQGRADAVGLLRAHGHEHTRTSWVLERVVPAPPAPPALPAGYALRAFRPGVDDEATYRVIEDAFSEWPGREPETFADWRAENLGRPGFAPDQIAVVTRGDEVVGARVDLVDGAEERWVGQLAVARAHRGRGLAKALLQHAFALTHAGGFRYCGLSTDSRTGALGLYEHVGMSVKRTYLHLSKELVG